MICTRHSLLLMTTKALHSDLYCAIVVVVRSEEPSIHRVGIMTGPSGSRDDAVAVLDCGTCRRGPPLHCPAIIADPCTTTRHSCASNSGERL